MDTISQIKELKQSLKDVRKTIKRLEQDPTPANIVLIAVYRGQQLQDETELRGLKVRNRVEAHGWDYDEWWIWAKSLYVVVILTSGNRLVKSNARDWKTQPSWEFDSEISCTEKIEQLVGYKMYDRNRGRGDMAQDLNQV